MNDRDIIPAGYTRVTECLKAYNNFQNIPELTLKNAADRGTRVHKYCELYAKGLFIASCDEDCYPYVENFKEWFDNNVEEVFHVEMRINSASRKLSGAIDLICMLKDDTRPVILDIKTPQKASLSWQLQTAAYRLLATEEIGSIMSYARRMCLMLPNRVSRLSEARTIEYENHLIDTKLYLNALEVYRFFNCDDDMEMQQNDSQRLVANSF